MGQVRLSTSLAPEVIIEEVRGDLQLRGWEPAEIWLKSASEAQPHVEEQDGRLHLRCEDSCLIRLPLAAQVHIQRVLGNLQIRGLEGALSIDQVMGSVELRHVSETQIHNVSGDLLARHVEGDFLADQVTGDAIVRHVQGDCRLQQVAGDGDISAVDGEVSAHILGDAVLSLSSLSGERYHLSAEGDLRCYLPQDASARLSLSSRARDIQIHLDEGSQQVVQSEYHLTLGDGQAEISLAAGGSLVFFNRETIYADEDSGIKGEAPRVVSAEVASQIADQIEAQIEAQLRALNLQLEQLSKTLKQAGISPAEAERIMEKAHITSERASALAREKMRRAQERLERKLAAVQQKAEQKARAAERKASTSPREPGTTRRAWSFEWTSPTTTPSSPVEAISDEERLIILRMLEQKKITVEQAEQLLAALEGKE